MIKKLYPDYKDRAITFSFDDGVNQDIRLVKLFNKYNLKCTFNFCGEKCQNRCFAIYTEKKSTWDGSEESRQCFKGHEIASHGLTHANLNECTKAQMEEQIEKDIELLSKAFDCEIKGFVSAYGAYNDTVIEILKKNNIVYHRTTKTKDNYYLGDDFLQWAPGPHFAYYLTDDGKKYLNNFFTCEDELPCLSIWGHSFELSEMDCYSKDMWAGCDKRWEFMENICKTVANRENVWYPTNIELFRYSGAMRKAEIGDTYIYNPTNTDLYFSVNGKNIKVKGNEKISI